MKKILFLFVFMSGFAMNVSAQKGMQGVGADAILSASGHEWTYMGLGPSVKYHYNITDYIRIQSSIGYTFCLDGHNGADGYGFYSQVSGHIFVGRPQQIRPYVDLGLDLASFESDDIYYNGYWSSYNIKNETTVQVHTGLGLDVRLTHEISIQAEAKYSFNKDYSGFFFVLGFAYNF